MLFPIGIKHKIFDWLLYRGIAMNKCRDTSSDHTNDKEADLCSETCKRTCPRT